MWRSSILSTWGINHYLHFCSFSVLSDAAESLQQFREAVFYSGNHQKMNELRSWATNYICKGKSPRHTYQQEFQAQNTLGWLPTEIFHQSVFYSTVAPISFFCQVVQHCRKQEPTSLVPAFISHTLFFWYSALLWYLVFRSKYRKHVTGLEMVARPLAVTFSLPSDLQL